MNDDIDDSDDDSLGVLDSMTPVMWESGVIMRHSKSSDMSSISTILCPAIHSLDSYVLPFQPIVVLPTAWGPRRPNISQRHRYLAPFNTQRAGYSP